MDKIIRISSVQGEHDILGNKNLVDYHINANSGVYNLRDSYISVNVSNTFKNDTAINTTGHVKGNTDHERIVFLNYKENATQRFVGAQFIVPPSTAVIVKNAQMVSSTKGVIESIRRVDMLRANQYSYVRNQEQLSSNVNGLLLTTEYGQNTCESRQPYTECVNIDQSATSTTDGQPVSSIYRDHEIRIPLQEVFNFCQYADMYDSAVYGQTHINLECQFDKLVAGQSNSNLLTTRYRATTGESFLGDMQDLPNTTGNNLTLINKAMTQNSYGLDGIELSPFYIGMKVKLDNSAGANNVVAKITTITSIVIYDGVSDIKFGAETVPSGTDLAIGANKGKLLLEFDGSYLDALANGANANGLKLTTHDLGGNDTQTLTIQNVDLVMKMVRGEGQAPKQIEYNKFDLEEDSFAIVQDKILNRYYDIPPNCDSIWLLLTRNQTYAFGDDNEKIDKYRITIDNVELSNRDIQMHSQLHKNLVAECLERQGLPLRSLNEQFTQWNFNDGVSSVKHDSFIIGVPVPNKPMNQKLGIEIHPVAGDTLKGFISVYKHRMAVV